MAGYFYRDTSRSRIVHDHHMSFESVPMTALEALCEVLPDHEDWIEWYGAALVYSEFFQARGTSASEPYDLLANSVWPRREVDRMAERFRERDQDPEPIIRQYEDGTEVADGYRLRVFPIWPNNRQHGGTGVHLAATVALSAAARLRNDLRLQELAARQFQWVLGANPFSQSLMYGEGYDFQPLFAYCMRDLVGALPVGMDCMSGDQPHWCSSSEATFKEVWVEPVNRFLGTLSVFLQQPQRADGVRIVNVNTEPDPEARTLRLSADVVGGGSHRIGVRSSNAKPRVTEIQVEVSGGEAKAIECDFSIEDPLQPWVIVLTVDDDPRTRTDVTGALVEPVGLG
jgi:hypothetical protein